MIEMDYNKQYAENNPNYTFIYETVVVKIHYDGLPIALKGLTNCYGISTRWYDSDRDTTRFKDIMSKECALIIDDDISKIPRDKELIIPKHFGVRMLAHPMAGERVYKYLMERMKQLDEEITLNIHNKTLSHRDEKEARNG
jgi:hypothetical protein